MKKHLVIIHGVGPFDQPWTEKSVAEMVDKAGYARNEYAIDSFNWRKLSHAPYEGDQVDEHWIVELGRAIHRARRIEQFEPDPSAPDASLLQSLIDGLLKLIEVPLLLWLQILLLSVVVGVRADLLGRCFLWALISYFVALCVGVIASDAPRLAVRAFVRRAVLTLIWPIVHFCLLSEILGISTRLFVTVCLLLAGTLVFTDIFRFQQLVIYFALIAALFSQVIVRGLRIVPQFLLTVISDATRYIGSPRHRHTIESGLHRKLDPLLRQADCELTLVAHSLGTVIAADYLLRRASPSSATVRLITLGSPINRWFARWFPGYWSHSSDLLRILAGRYRDFRWANVYRPGDPIGTKLCLPVCAEACERGTRQRRYLWGGLSAHLNYWGDPQVAREVRAAFGEMQTQPRLSARTGTKRQRYRPPAPDNNLWPTAFIRFATLNGTPLALVFVTVTLIAAPIVQGARRELLVGQDIYRATGPDIRERDVDIRCTRKANELIKTDVYYSCAAEIEGKTYPVRLTQGVQITVSRKETVKYRVGHPENFVRKYAPEPSLPWVEIAGMHIPGVLGALLVFSFYRPRLHLYGESLFGDSYGAQLAVGNSNKTSTPRSVTELLSTRFPAEFMWRYTDYHRIEDMLAAAGIDERAFLAALTGDSSSTGVDALVGSTTSFTDLRDMYIAASFDRHRQDVGS